MTTAVHRLVAPLLAALALAVALVPPPASAQASGDATGSIEGAVRNGTEGATLGPDLSVMLIRIEGGEVSGSEEATVEDGRFRFEVEPSQEITYVLRAVYDGVQYLSQALRLSADQPSAIHDLTVYETTTEAPALAIQETTVTVIALDRAEGRITLLREDLVANPSDRVYVGADGGATLLLPAPDGALEAGGLNPEAEFVFEGGAVAATSPLRPGLNSVVTQYTVAYDIQSDRYRLRVTAPVDAERVTLRVPARFVREVDPAVPTRRAQNVEIEGERLLVYERTRVGPGQGVVADLVGLSGIRPASNPLTEPAGAAAGAAVALAVLAAAVVVATRARRRGEAS